MKKKIYYLFAAVILAAVATSCCHTKTYSTVKTTSPETSQVVADLEISHSKITETVSYEFKVRDKVNHDDLKDNAVFEALAKSRADILVAPQFKISRRYCGGSSVDYTITVTGYPATYSNFRQLPQAERMELRELKDSTAYMIVKKSTDNNDAEYDKDIIVVNVKCAHPWMEVSDKDLDRVIPERRAAKTVEPAKSCRRGHMQCKRHNK